MIREAFLAQATNLAGDPALAQELWLQIEAAYAEPDRYYHNLDHLEHLWRELHPLQDEIGDWQTLFFTLCYHDAVYDVPQNAVQNDNEERSAAFAETQLRQLFYPVEKIERCKQQILATQKHSFAADDDTNLFTDADLSILGQPWPVYEAYQNAIRNEFQMYPTSIYNAGRRKVLNYFLRLNPLFKTSHFNKLYEGQAKENIAKELQLLQETE